MIHHAMTQLAIDLPVQTSYGRADFLVSDCNRAALGWIDRWPDWPCGALVMHGPAGSGKTHLAHLWRERTGGQILAGEAVARIEPTGFAAVASATVAVDDADRAAEVPLLHLFNSCLERGTSVLLIMREPPALTTIALADLASRVRALPVVGIAPPDDPLLGDVLVKHFGDRQLLVAPGVIAYLVPRMERSFTAAARLAARLDYLALSAGRPVTIRLARRVLAEIADQSLPPSDLTVT